MKNHDVWQTSVLTALGPKMEKTNSIMLQLLEALKEEAEVLRQHKQLIDEGPRHLATIAYVKQRQAKESTSFQKSEDQMLNFTCLQRHFLNAAMQMAHTPTPEQLKRFTAQLETIHGKQKDSEKQLHALQAQYEKLFKTERIGSRALVAISNEMTSVRRVSWSFVVVVVVFSSPRKEKEGEEKKIS
jgi:7,8-dihydro-6-hydroxymethylpterin-pyrophosphokinase